MITIDLNSDLGESFGPEVAFEDLPGDDRSQPRLRSERRT